MQILRSGGWIGLWAGIVYLSVQNIESSEKPYYLKHESCKKSPAEIEGKPVIKAFRQLLNYEKCACIINLYAIKTQHELQNKKLRYRFRPLAKKSCETGTTNRF